MMAYTPATVSIHCYRRQSFCKVRKQIGASTAVLLTVMGLGNRRQSFLSRNLVLGNALGPASLGHLAWVLGTLSPEPRAVGMGNC